jgi:branched-chain amino acid transport system permease protein
MTGVAVRMLRRSETIVVLATVGFALAVAARAGLAIVVDSLVTGGMWALIAMGLVLVFGVMNVPNFAQGEFFMVGTLAAYLTYSALGSTFTVDSDFRWALPFITLSTALLVGIALGVCVDRAIFASLRRRLREHWTTNTFVLTVGLSVVLINAHQLIWGADYKGIIGYWHSSPLDILGVSVGRDALMALVIAVVAIAMLGGFLRYVQLGRAIRAVSQDSSGALMMGINVEYIYTVTFAISCALAALAGAALLFMFPSYPYVGVRPLYIAWTVVILAGLRNVAGAIVGGFLVALLASTTAFYLGSEWSDVIPFILIIIILAVRPYGLFSGGSVRGVWEQ